MNTSLRFWKAHMRFRWSIVFAGAIAVSLLTGCVDREVSGHQAIYRFSEWVGPMVIGLGVIGIALSLLMLKVREKWALPIMLLIMLIPILLIAVIAPAIYSDKVLIDDEHFEARYGFWFSPTEQKVWFKNLRRIKYVQVKRGESRRYYELQCESKTGQTTCVPAGDLVSRTVTEILARAQARNVPIVK